MSWRYYTAPPRRKVPTLPPPDATIVELVASGYVGEPDQFEEPPDPFWDVSSADDSDLSWLFPPVPDETFAAQLLLHPDHEVYFPDRDDFTEELSGAWLSGDVEGVQTPIFTLSNTNEGGTDGVTITTGNSGGGSGDAWTVIGAAVAPNALKFDSAQAGGTLASNIHYQGISDTISFGWNPLAKRENRLWGRMYVWLSTYLIGNESRVFLLFYGGPPESGHTGIGLNAVGTLVLETVGGTNIDTSPTAIPLEKWARLEIMWERNQQNTGTVEWRIYFDPNSSTPDYSASFTNRNGGSGDYDSVEPFSITRGSGTFIDFYTDDMAVSTVGWLGPSGTTFVNNERPSLIANHYSGITPEYPYEFIDEALDFNAAGDISILIPPVLAADDSYIATLDNGHDELGGLYPDDLSDYQPAYDDAPHTLFNDGPLFPDDLTPTLALNDDQAWSFPDPDPTNDQPLVDTALEALFSDGPVANEVNFAQPLMSPELEVYFPERDYTDETPFLDHVGEVVNDGPLFPDDLVPVLDIAWDQAAFPEWDYTNDQPIVDGAIEAFLAPALFITDELIAIVSDTVTSDLEVLFPLHDHTLDQEYRDGAAEILYNDGPLAADEVHAAQPLLWPDLEITFPPDDPTNDQPLHDGSVEAFLAGPPLFAPTEILAAQPEPTSDHESLFPLHDYTLDQPYQDGAAEALLNDGPLFPDWLVPVLWLPDHADHTPPDPTNDQPLVDGAFEAIVAGELPLELFPRPTEDAWFGVSDEGVQEAFDEAFIQIVLAEAPSFDAFAALEVADMPTFDAEHYPWEDTADQIAVLFGEVAAALDAAFVGYEFMGEAPHVEPDPATEFYGWAGGTEFLFAADPVPPGTSPPGVAFDPSIDGRRRRSRQLVGAERFRSRRG